jgi:hypothetical protein
MNMKLLECLWEITGKCNKNCEYCGSKDAPKGQLSSDELKTIAREISSYGVPSITLTGGEPGLIPYPDLKEIIKSLRVGVQEVKVVTNGLIFQDNKKAKLFDRIGLSVNALHEINWATKLIEGSPVPVTIITNFGTHNFFDLEPMQCAIEKLCGRFAHLFWQIQLTVGKFQLPTNGIEAVWKSIRKNDRFVFADNLQPTHECTAGLNGCSILWNGNVVACLSERSYHKDMITYGNLLRDSLKDIWETQFRDIRFGCGTHKHCRDCFKYPAIVFQPPTIPWKITIPNSDDSGSSPNNIPTEEPHVIMYGVWPREASPVVTMYGVFPPKDSTFMYGVFSKRMYGVTGSGKDE